MSPTAGRYADRVTACKPAPRMTSGVGPVPITSVLGMTVPIYAPTTQPTSGLTIGPSVLVVPPMTSCQRDPTGAAKLVVSPVNSEVTNTGIESARKWLRSVDRGGAGRLSGDAEDCFGLSRARVTLAGETVAIASLQTPR